MFRKKKLSYKGDQVYTGLINRDYYKEVPNETLFRGKIQISGRRKPRPFGSFSTG